MYGFLKLRNIEIAEAAKAEDHTHGICGWLSNFDNRNVILGFIGRPRATWYAASPAYHLQLLLQIHRDFDDMDALQSIADGLSKAKTLCSDSIHLDSDARLVADLLDGGWVSRTHALGDKEVTY